MTERALKVLVAVAKGTGREALAKLLSEHPLFDVCRVVSNPAEILASTKKLRPNVIIVSDKLEQSALVAAITDVMVDCPTPIVVVSASNQSEKSAVSLQALDAGALSVVRLPAQREIALRSRAEQELLATVRAMAQVKLVRRWRQAQPPAPPARRQAKGPAQVVAIAASTGGPAVLKTILDDLPLDFPAPLLIVQHIARGFIAGVAEWLDQTSPLQIRVARNGERLRAGTAYFAPDDLQLGVNNQSSIRLSDDGPVKGFRPSATYLFESVAKSFAHNAVAVILTGMGEDGLEGLRKLRAVGGRIIAQSESSSVVFGMPGVVVRQGLADQVLEPDSIGSALVEACRKQVNK